MGLFKKTSKKNIEETGILATEQSEWLKDSFEEGQLSVDVYQDEDNLYIKSTIAGVRSENIDVAINYDMLTIRGTREEQSEVSEESYLYKECYWGSFSRSIILPFEVRTEKIDATLENGILTVVLPKAKKNKQISIKVKER